MGDGARLHRVVTGPDANSRLPVSNAGDLVLDVFRT